MFATYIAQLVSILFHPLFMPLYGIVLILRFTYLSLAGPQFKWILTAVVATFTWGIPTLLILFMRLWRMIPSLSLSERKNRPIVYFFVLLCYGALILLLYRMNIPAWTIRIFYGATFALFTTFLITLYWKISAHATAIGGMIGGMMGISQQFHLIPAYGLIAAFLLAGLIGSARLYLNAHTPAQIYLGFINGLLTIYASFFMNNFTLNL